MPPSLDIQLMLNIRPIFNTRLIPNNTLSVFCLQAKFLYICELKNSDNLLTNFFSYW